LQIFPYLWRRWTFRMERFIKGTEEIFTTGKKELPSGWRA
jgi:hypothetical protein